MPLPKAPASCTHLDLAEVSRVLAKHYGDIPTSARELNIPTPDLRRLTWSKPKLLEEAELERMGVIARAWSVLIEALDSDDPRRQMWASDKIMSSWLARDHPLAPARRGVASAGKSRTITFRWASLEGADPVTDAVERDRRSLAVPRYGGDRDDLVEGEPIKPSALIEAAPALPARAEPAPRRKSRRLSRGGYR